MGRRDLQVVAATLAAVATGMLLFQIWTVSPEPVHLTLRLVGAFYACSWLYRIAERQVVRIRLKRRIRLKPAPTLPERERGDER